MPPDQPLRNPVERLLAIVVIIVSLSITAYLLGWAMWLW
jgi:hypothetical protein